MKSLCILSGCPAGARKWHISHFAVLLHSKYSEFPAGRGIASPGIFATLKAREMNPYIGSTGTYVETVQPNGEASAVVADNVVTVND